MTQATRNFVVESWKIEGLTVGGSQLESLVNFHEWFLGVPAPLQVEDIELAARFFAGANGLLRERYGMDVMVGDHYPPKGGVYIKPALESVLTLANNTDPYLIHHQFEHLHPFIDGNGRVGRLLWAWCMDHCNLPWRERGFLHTWYYQSLRSNN